MMLLELALKNVRTQLKHYVMYFISMAFSVMVYYSFIAMSLDKNLVGRIGTDQNLAGSLQAASVMIVLFILVFMYTANGFFLKKRKKEIGLYSLLGMRRLQIGFLFFVENCAIGLVSLVTGLLGGVIFSKFFSMLLIRVMFLELDSTFAFSLAAVKGTSLMFVVILVAVSLRSGVAIYRNKLVDLFKATQKGERLKKVNWLTWLLGLTGVGLLSYGYYQASHLIDYSFYLTEKTQTDMGFIYGIMLILLYCVTGSYLFFHGFMPVVISLMGKMKQFYYRDIRMVTIGGLRFHLKKNATTLGTIAVLSGTALAAIGGATNVYTYGMDIVNGKNPMDFIVDSRQAESLERLLGEYAEFPIKEQVAVTIKQVGGYYEEFTFGQTFQRIGPLSVIALSNYQELEQANAFLSPITLSQPDQVVLFERFVGNEALINSVSVSGLMLQGQEGTFNIQERRSDKLGGGGSVRYNLSTIVVTDQLFAALSSEHAYGMTLINVENADKSEALSQAVTARVPDQEYQQAADFSVKEGQLIGDIQPEIPYPDNENQEASLLNRRSTIDSRYPALKMNRITYGTLVYIAIFLGVVFLFATGSIIMLKQLSEAQEEKARYQMLRKIGVLRNMIKASVYRQNLLIFCAPVVIAYLHSKYALVVLSFMVAGSNNSLTWLARGFLLIIYFGFYFVTASSYNRTVNDV